MIPPRQMILRTFSHRGYCFTFDGRDVPRGCFSRIVGLWADQIVNIERELVRMPVSPCFCPILRRLTVYFSRTAIIGKL